MKDNIKEEIKTEKEKVRCIFCGREFDDEDYMYEHINKTHISYRLKKKYRQCFGGNI